MNWKVFITASISCALLAVPENSFTCGASEDPFDYYTSFFNKKAGTSEFDRPFYYTALLTFYDDWDNEAGADSMSYVNKKIAEEWKDYGKSNKIDDAIQLVYLTGVKEKAALLSSLDGKPIPSALSRNTLVQNFIKEKKKDALSYLLFASKTEDISSSEGWEDRKRDSLELNRYITEASQSFQQTTDPFIKNKWAFQRCKLAFYNHRYADCIRWYDEFFNESNTSAVYGLALSYKAGSLFHLDKNKEAAYTFSKAFTLSDQTKKKNFLGFLWATQFCNQQLLNDYTSVCRNNAEKANMIAMFGMYGSSYCLDNLQKVYSLHPASPLLPLLATREISKLEEQYLTPMLQKEKGGKQQYVSFMEYRQEQEGNKQKKDERAQVTKTAQFFETLLADKNIPNRSLYGAGAAYLHFMNKNYEGAKNILSKTKELQQSEKIKDQLQLINLLIAANEGTSITKEREAQLLPSLKWLVQKAKENRDYEVFCRNFFSEILAQKYEQQGDVARAAFAYAMADLAFLQQNTDNYYYQSAIDFVQSEMSTENLVKLYDVMTKPTTETEKFFIQNASVKRDHVVDVIGTSYLRDRNYDKAIEWLSKAGKTEVLAEDQYNYQTNKSSIINIDPFYDYLNDWQRFDKSLPAPYTKLTLAKKLQEMKTKIDAGNIAGDKSKLYYQYASALYNLSFYGNSWNAVAYHRSSSEWNRADYELSWEKEFYGVYEARNFYQKAYEAATDKEFKAACLFMVAKCAQKQVPRPAYDYNNYEQYEKAEAVFFQKFKNNPLFAKFKSEFGSTKFYQYTYNRCSYLRDYVKQTAPAKTPVKPKSKG